SASTVLTDRVAALSDQTTNLTSETRAKDTNAMARLKNRTIAGRDLPLSPLVNPTTGAAIPRFPATPAALSAQSGQDLMDILTILGENVHPDVSTQEKKRLLRATVGLVDIS
ncbi:MAG: hypothetical protein M1840_000114, partial [Geoglossum simile]